MCVGQYGLRQAHHLTVRGVGRQDVCSHGADILRQRHHQLFADGVDGRVRHLRKLLTEIVEEHLRTITHHSQRRIVTHRSHRLLSGCRHRDDRLIDVLLSEAEVHEFALEVAHAILHVTAALQLLQLHAVLTQPLAVGMCLGKLLFDLTVVVDLTLLRVNQQDLTWLQAAFRNHVARFEVHHAHL